MQRDVLRDWELKLAYQVIECMQSRLYDFLWLSLRCHRFLVRYRNLSFTAFNIIVIKPEGERFRHSKTNNFCRVSWIFDNA